MASSYWSFVTNMINQFYVEPESTVIWWPFGQHLPGLLIYASAVTSSFFAKPLRDRPLKSYFFHFLRKRKKHFFLSKTSNGVSKISHKSFGFVFVASGCGDQFLHDFSLDGGQFLSQFVWVLKSKIVSLQNSAICQRLKTLFAKLILTAKINF